MESAMYFIIIIRAGNFLADEAWLVTETNANSPENRNSDGNFELAYEILAPTRFVWRYPTSFHVGTNELFRIISSISKYTTVEQEKNSGVFLKILTQIIEIHANTSSAPCG